MSWKTAQGALEGCVRGDGHDLGGCKRGTANTRWRGFGDTWSLSRQHSVAADDLASTIAEVTGRSNSDHIPEQFALVLDVVITFADPVRTGHRPDMEPRRSGLGATTPTTWDPGRPARCGAVVSANCG